MHNTLLHREALLVVSAGDSEDVTLELVANAVTRNLLAHAAVHEDAQLALIVDFDQFLRAIGWVGDIQLHLDERCRDEEAERGRLSKSRLVLRLLV